MYFAKSTVLVAALLFVATLFPQKTNSDRSYPADVRDKAGLPSQAELPAFIKFLAVQGYTFDVKASKDSVVLGETVAIEASVQKKEFAVAGKQVIAVGSDHLLFEPKNKDRELTDFIDFPALSQYSQANLDFDETDAQGKVRFFVEAFRQGKHRVEILFLHPVYNYTEHIDSIDFFTVSPSEFNWHLFFPFALVFVFVLGYAIVLVFYGIKFLLKKNSETQFKKKPTALSGIKSLIGKLMPWHFLFPALGLFFLLLKATDRGKKAESKAKLKMAFQFLFFQLLAVLWLATFILKQEIALLLAGVMLAVGSSMQVDGNGYQQREEKKIRFQIGVVTRRFCSDIRVLLQSYRHSFVGFVGIVLLMSSFFNSYQFLPFAHYGDAVFQQVFLFTAVFFVFFPVPLISLAFFLLACHRYWLQSNDNPFSEVFSSWQIFESQQQSFLYSFFLLMILCFISACFIPMLSSLIKQTKPTGQNKYNQ